MDELTVLTEKEASKILSVGRQTLANWRHLGCGPAYLRMNRRVGYRVKDIQD